MLGTGVLSQFFLYLTNFRTQYKLAMIHDQLNTGIDLASDKLVPSF
jgi:hypothetical protein